MTTLIDDTKTNETNTVPLNTLALKLLTVLEEFNTLLQTETEALELAHFEEVEKLQPTKRDLAKEYSALVTTFSERKGDVKNLDKPLQERIIKLRTTFTQSLHDNMRALELMKRSTQRLANRILTIARDQIKEECQTNYSAVGQMQAYKTSSLSINLDQEL